MGQVGRAGSREPILIIEMPVPLVAVTKDPLSLDALSAVVADGAGADGAVTSFVGLVRQDNLGRKVAHLDYEAYEPLAVRGLERIVDEAKANWPSARPTTTHLTSAWRG